MRIQKPLEFASSPSAHLRSVLLYGNNSSLQQFYLNCLKASLPSSGFHTIDSIKQLPAISTPSLLAEENNRQLVYLTTAHDRDLAAICSFVEDPFHTHTLVIACSLPTKSKLVSFFVDHKSFAALACYDLKPHDLKSFMTLSAKKKGVTFTPDALTFLAETFASLPALLLPELEKLFLHHGHTEAPINLENAKSVTGYYSQVNLDNLTQGLWLGDQKLLLSALSLSLIEDEFILMIRTLIKQGCQLFELLTHLRNDVPYLKALDLLSSPVFFQLKPTFAKAVERWSLETCAQCLERLLLLEKSYKNQELNPAQVQATLLSML